MSARNCSNSLGVILYSIAAKAPWNLSIHVFFVIALSVGYCRFLTRTRYRPTAPTQVGPQDVLENGSLSGRAFVGGHSGLPFLLHEGNETPAPPYFDFCTMTAYQPRPSYSW